MSLISSISWCLGYWWMGVLMVMVCCCLKLILFYLSVMVS